jgi:hypothetical protein
MDPRALNVNPGGVKKALLDDYGSYEGGDRKGAIVEGTKTAIGKAGAGSAVPELSGPGVQAATATSNSIALNVSVSFASETRGLASGLTGHRE